MAENSEWRSTLVPNSATLHDVIDSLNTSARKIVVVVDKQGRIQGTVSDGDLRRGLIRGVDLNGNVSHIINSNALTVTPRLDKEQVVEIMVKNKVQQIPVIDDKTVVIGMHFLEDLTMRIARKNRVVIMCGGKGERLLPLTANCPKPMVKVGDKPMLHHIIDRIKGNGFTHFTLAVHHLGHMIEDYFGDGAKFGVTIDYLRESKPLGTAGALSLITDVEEEPVLVTNGDLITDIRCDDLLDFHLRSGAEATMAVRLHEWKNPFGVVHTDGAKVVGYEEKPVIRSQINAGVYVLSPSALTKLELDAYCDMPTLIQRLASESLPVHAYSMFEPWADVGRPSDWQHVNAAVGSTPKDDSVGKPK